VSFVFIHTLRTFVLGRFRGKNAQPDISMSGLFIIHTLNSFNMFAEAKLVFQNYVPTEIKKGMLFMSFDKNNQPIVYETNVITTSKEQLDNFIQANGYPVKPYIYIEGNPNVADSSYCIATPDEIGWFDRGAQYDSLFDLTVKEFNIILENDGVLDIEIEHEMVHFDHDDEGMEGYDLVPMEDLNGHLVPTLLQGLVTVRFEEEDYDDDDEEEEEEPYDNICNYCSGTGMGQYEGTSCRECHGKGFIVSSNYDDWDDYYPDND
jgi:hypothetical protein